MTPQGGSDRACAGTTLARAAVMPPVEARASSGSPTAEAVWRGQRDRMFLAETRKTSLIMIGLGVFVQVLLLCILCVADYPPWRVVALGTVYVVFATAHRMIMHTTLEPRHTASSFITMSVTAQLFIVGSAALTGGVHSPFLPGTALPAIISLLFFGPQAVSRWIAVGNGLLIVGMVMLPESIVGPSLPTVHYAISVVIALAWNLFMLHLLVGKLSVVASRAGESMACLREERLADAEAQLRRLQSVGAKVAHELKNPLASIKGLCQLVARTPESERTQERLAVVASEISRMETILGEYLSFSRPLEDIRPETIELGKLARDVLDVLDGRAVQAGVKLTLEGTARPVQGDPRRLKEALINIVSNALEATPSGGLVALKIRDATAAVVLEVRDTGRGIRTEDLERLGTSFFTTREDGTGLGVVLAQGVITQHGGSLAYVSTVGKGTTATVTLPQDAAPRTEATPRAALAEARA
jgi:signal transduction histidine kinase